ncbi:MAG: helix-turn-helix domain-containing protein [Betaproteobacteria bacterium]|nr:MAG: helix-turn-helix domain-containing protein [Betaproteobacteria bacterium]
MSEGEGAAGAVAGVDRVRPGRALADARARRKLTVDEVAQQLKLSATQVDALEADAYDRLPGPVFVRGFVRNYARLLELDAEPLVAAIEVPATAGRPGAVAPYSKEIPFPEQRPKSWLPYALGLAVVIGAVVVFEFFFSAPPSVVVSPVAPQPVPPPIQHVAPPAPVPAELPPGEAATPATLVAEPVAAEVPAQKPPGMAAIRFVFETSSWVEVRDRENRILMSQLNAAGAAQQVQGRPPLQVVVGNAQGVRLIYNGQPFDMGPHIRADVARFTLE